MVFQPRLGDATNSDPPQLGWLPEETTKLVFHSSCSKSTQWLWKSGAPPVQKPQLMLIALAPCAAAHSIEFTMAATSPKLWKLADRTWPVLKAPPRRQLSVEAITPATWVAWPPSLLMSGLAGSQYTTGWVLLLREVLTLSTPSSSCTATRVPVPSAADQEYG